MMMCASVPDMDLVIFISYRGQQAPIWAECEGRMGICKIAEGCDGLKKKRLALRLFTQLPQTDFLITTNGCNQLSVRAKSCFVDPLLWAPRFHRCCKLRCQT